MPEGPVAEAGRDGHRGEPRDQLRCYTHHGLAGWAVAAPFGAGRKVRSPQGGVPANGRGAVLKRTVYG